MSTHERVSPIRIAVCGETRKTDARPEFGIKAIEIVGNVVAYDVRNRKTGEIEEVSEFQPWMG